MLTTTERFNDIAEKVSAIADTEVTYLMNTKTDYERLRESLSDVSHYSGYGLFSAGSRLGFPASFVAKHYKKHPETTAKVIKDCYDDFFAKAENPVNKRQATGLMARTFEGVVCGVLTDKYSIFDDKEVVDILKSNSYLMDAEEFWYDISPEHFHTRFVSKDVLDFDGDDSPLHFCVFVDNSMVGESSLRVRFGLYRSACTNGCIFGFKEFEIVREMHKGTKEYEKILAEALEKCDEYEETLKKAVAEMSITKSSIYSLPDAVALSYLHDKLAIDRKACAKIYEIYNESYNGESKWDLCNAITEYAHDVGNISERIRLERLATQVA